MTARIRLLAVIAVVVTTMPFTAATAGGSPGDATAAARAEHQRIVDFWTPERVARAVPRDFLFDRAAGRFEPAAKPPGTPGGGGDKGGGGSGGESALITGSSWTKGGEIDAASGKVLFAMDGGYYVCSATVIEDPSTNGRSLIITAAHCVYDETAGEFAAYWVFIPDYDDAPAPLTADGSFCASTTYGCWSALQMSVHDGYAAAGGFNDRAVPYDFAVVAVGPGGHDMSLLETLVAAQSFDFGTDASDPGEMGHAFGYPAEKKWKGNDLIYCAGPIDTDPYNADATYRIAECKLNGGSSGGPWFQGFSETAGSGTLISVNSYGYTGINAMHGPILNADTADVYTAALTGTGGVVVP